MTLADHRGHYVARGIWRVLVVGALTLSMLALAGGLLVAFMAVT